MGILTILNSKGSTVHTISRDRSLETCVELMNLKKIGALIVTDAEGKIDGIITERDILHAVGKHEGSIQDLKVVEVMTQKSKLIVTDVGNSIENILEIMTNNRIRHLPVMEDGELAGIISIGDVVKDKLNQTLFENQLMRDYIVGSRT